MINPQAHVLMKNPCPLCNERKAQRLCFRENNANICSVCCAKMRNERCAGCSYYSASQQYQTDRSQRATQAALPGGHFVVKFDPEVEDAANSAIALYEQGKTDAAWARLTQLLRAHPKNHVVCYAMGVLHAFQEEHKEAVKWFDKAISIYPYLTEAHFNKAVVYQKQLKIAEAVYAYRQVLKFCDPNDAIAGKSRSFLEEIAAAIRENEGVDLDSYIEALQMFDSAFALMEQRDWSGALAGFRASAMKHDRNAPPHGNMGICLAALGYKAQALAELDRALAIDPQYEPAETNRVLVAHMKEGVPLNTAGFTRVEFGKAQFLDATRGQ